MGYKTIEADAIQFQIEADDWEEAIRKTAMPLVKQQKVLPEYVEEMIRVVKTEGPYFVIMKHVAMPHAKAECGALETAVSLATLRNPVYFGHKNDPVKYIICLSSVNGEEHLQNISRIADLLGKEDFFQVLDTTSNKDVVCKFFNQ